MDMEEMKEDIYTPREKRTDPKSEVSETESWRGYYICGLIYLCFMIFAWQYKQSKLETLSPIPFTGPPTEFSPFAHLVSHCADAKPIDESEFHHRQKSLAKTLHVLNASAYIAEPGANAGFFGNLTKYHWSLSERPLLLIVTPVVVSGDVQAKLTVLTPKFEATRAKSLSIPSELGDVRYVEWAEEMDPYKVAEEAIRSGPGVTKHLTVYVDNTIRKFLVDGLQSALGKSADVRSAPGEITQLRERKSPAELELLKCANEVTLLAIREVHSNLHIGIRESEARGMMSSALSSAGLKDGGCLTLFGENAALPHGTGTDRALGKSDFALFDCTASLHGYYSDVTRTVALPDSQIPEPHRHIWNYVHSAQTIASHKATAGALTRQVDEAARWFLDVVGHREHFTHRLGHGIGLEVHEQPYLRGGSFDVIKTGHTFSNEPGIYIEGEVGVRLEDCFYVDEGTSKAVFLTAGVGGQSSSPWSP